MDLVEKVVEILKRDGETRTLDLRVTYTHSGVKVNLSFVAHTHKQTKPFPTLNKALIDALTSYNENLHARIKGTKRDIETGNAAQILHAETNKEIYLKHLPNALKALRYVEFVSL